MVILGISGEFFSFLVFGVCVVVMDVIVVVLR